MIRLMALLLFLSAGIAAMLTVKSCSERDPAAGPPAANFDTKVAILGDRTPIFAPNGTIGRTLADWLQDSRSTQHYFEVGGAQFGPGVADPLPEAKARLTRLAAMLQAYPEAQAQVIGFAAPPRNGVPAAQLARERSQRVIELLVTDGVRRSRLGLGEQPPPAASSKQPGVLPDRIALLLRYPKQIPPGDQAR